MKNLKSTFNGIGILLLCISAFGISSCKDEEENPVIDLDSPLTQEHYNTGDEIHFRGHVTDNEEIESIDISLWEEDDTNNAVFQVLLQPGVASYHIDTSFMVTTTDTTEYMFKVYAIDNDGNITQNPDGLHVHINQ